LLILNARPQQLPHENLSHNAERRMKAHGFCRMARVFVWEDLLRAFVRGLARVSLILIAAAAMALPVFFAQTEKFYNAPDSAKQMANPVQGQATAVSAGRRTYKARCRLCRGK